MPKLKNCLEKTKMVRKDFRPPAELTESIKAIEAGEGTTDAEKKVAAAKVVAEWIAKTEAEIKSLTEPAKAEKVTQPAESVTETPTERDTRYARLAEDPETNEPELRKMLEGEAGRNGFTIQAFHGGTAENVLDPTQAQEEEGLFLSSSEEVASGYRDPEGVDLEKAEAALKGASDAQVDALAKDLDSYGETREEKEEDIREAFKVLDEEGDPSMFETLNEYAAKLGQRGVDIARMGGRTQEVFLKLERPTRLHREDTRGGIETLESPSNPDGVIRTGFMDAKQSGAFGDGVVSTIYSTTDPTKVKSAALVVKDDQGKLVPLSKRFAPTNDLRGEVTESDTSGKPVEETPVAEQVTPEPAKKVTPSKDAPYTAEGLKQAFDLTDEQATVAKAVGDALGATPAMVARGGEPGAGALPQMPVSPEQDAAYMAAVESGDVAEQQRLVDEAAKTAGGIKVFKGFSEAYPLNVKYGGWFAERKSEADKFSDEKDASQFFILPRYVEEIEGRGEQSGEVQSGAYVSPAEGFDPPTEAAIAYKKANDNPLVRAVRITNTRDEGTVWRVKPAGMGLIKSADPVTRDADGNVIPLSQRFNPESPSILYQKPVSPEQAARHAELEAKYKAGAITPEETAEAERMVEAAARAAGYDEKAYHGTQSPAFEEFNPNLQTSFPSIPGGIYFGPEWMAKDYGPNVGSYYLRMTNPFVAKTKEEFGFLESLEEEPQTATQKLKELGFDSALLREHFDNPDHLQKVVFDPAQIKSADPFTGVPLSQRFNPESPSILYQGQRAAETARFNELTADLYEGNPEPSAEDIAAWKAANPEKWTELSEMREKALKEAGYTGNRKFEDNQWVHGGTEGITVFESRFGEFYFSDERFVAESFGGTTYQVYLKTRNPLTVDAEGGDKYSVPFEGEKISVDDFAYEARRRGHDSAIIENVVDNAGGDPDPSDVAVVFDPAQIKSADPISPGPKVTPDQWADTSDPSILKQGPKGSMEVAEDGKIILRGLQSPDFTTAVHELAHAARRNLDTTLTPEETKTVEDWAGAEDGKWDRNAEERWSRGWEKYFHEGKAPLKKLQAIFDKIAAWMTEVYQNIQGSEIDVEITPEVRAIFDRLAAKMDLPSAEPAPEPAKKVTPEATTAPKPAAEPEIVLEDDGKVTEEEALEDPDLTAGKHAKLNADLTILNRQLENMGEKPLQMVNPAEPTKLEDVAAEALSMFDQNEDVGRELMDDLMAHPRTWGTSKVSGAVEHAIARIELAKRKAVVWQRLQEQRRAETSGSPYTKAKANIAVMDAMKDVEAAAGAIGQSQSEMGLAFRASQDYINTDFSLETVLKQWVNVAYQGDEDAMTEEKKVEIAEMVDSLERAKADHAELVTALDIQKGENTKLEEENVEAQAQLATMLEAAEKAEAKGAKRESAVSRRFKKRTAENRAKSEKALKEMGWLKQEEGSEDVTKLHASILPESTVPVVKHFANVVLDWMADGLVAVGDIKVKLLDMAGDAITPLANRIIREAKVLYHGGKAAALQESLAAGGDVETVESVKKDADPQAIVDGIDENQELQKKDVWRLARAFVISEGQVSGILDMVTDHLQAKFPGITRAEVTTAFTGYGKTKKPKSGTDEQFLRNLNEMERIGLAIDDINAGRKPKKTGYLRDKPKANVRDLRKKFNRLYKESGLAEDSEESIRTAFGAMKRHRENEIEELDAAVKSGKARAKKGSSLPKMTKEERDELAKLDSELKKARKRYDEEFGSTAELSMKERVENLIRHLDKQIASEQKALDEKILRKDPAEPVEKTPEIVARQKKLSDLREQRRDLDPEANLRLAKRATEAATERLRDIVKRGWVEAKEKRTVDPDEELEAMLRVKDALEDDVREIRKAMPLTPAQEVAKGARQLRAAEANVARLQKKIDNKDLSTKPKNLKAAGRSEALRRMRDKAAQLNRELAALRKEAKVGQFSDEAQAKRRMKSLGKVIKEVRRRIRDKDYAPKTRPEPVTNDMVEAAQKRVNLERQKLAVQMIKDKRASRTRTRKILDGVLEAYFVTGRTLKTAIDMGTIGRQLHVANVAGVIRGAAGKAANVARGKEGGGERAAAVAKALPKNFTFTLEQARKAEAEMEKHPLYNFMKNVMKIQFTSVDATSVAETEEAFRSEFAEKFPGVKWSKYSYIAGINAMKFESALAMLGSLQQQGTLSPEAAKMLGNHINILTGRGNLGNMENNSDLLAKLLFSPKYWASRVQILYGIGKSAVQFIPNARKWESMGPADVRAVRQEIAKDHAAIAGGLVAWMSLLKLAAAAALAAAGGDEDEAAFTFSTDLLSTDFGKIKFKGGTRVDTGAGLFQNMVIMSQILAGRRTKQDGETEIFRSQNIPFTDIGQKRNTQQTDTLGQIANFLRKKAAPGIGAPWDVLAEEGDTGIGSDVIGGPVTWESALVGLYTPISANEMVGSFKDLGFAKGAASSLANFFGFGTSTYGDGIPDYKVERHAVRELATFVESMGVPMKTDERYQDFPEEALIHDWLMSQIGK